MKVEALTLGPIVGATTASSVRLFGRGGLEISAGCPRRCFGVARLKPRGGRFGKPVIFKMSPTFDLTGVVVFEGLEPESVYDYEMGWFFAEAELDELSRSMRLDWDEASRSAFRTGTDDREASRSIVLGSCRYLLRLFGGVWFDRRGDKTFDSILRQMDAGIATDALIMTGDQIYADDLAFVSPDTLVDDYLRRYRDAFGQPRIRELMSRVPTYMILDDHEIEDSWPRNAGPVDWMVKYPAAIHAYQTYQASHSPLFETDAERIKGIPQKLWYRFSDGCCDIFVMDVRTERFLSVDPSTDRMVSAIQLDALKAWLVDGSGRVKLVVTPVPFFPDTLGKREDQWSGFPAERDELLSHIVENGIERVAFLSGDVHASLSAELRGIAGTRARMISVISSPFYWPYPHQPAVTIELEGMLRAGEHTFELAEAGPVHSTDNFTRLTVHPDRIEVAVYERKGGLLGAVKVHSFS